MDGVAYLIPIVDFEEDAIGQQIRKEGQPPRDILVTENYIQRNEFFSASTKGLIPEYMLTTATVNYEGERFIEYKGERYTIYRTYPARDEDEIELYLGRRAADVKG